MPETLLAVLWWCLIAVSLTPIVLGFGWAVFEGSILPRLISPAEIERLADDIMRRYPADPEGAAFTEEHAAWFRSEICEQGKWRRVRKLIRHRLS